MAIDKKQILKRAKEMLDDVEAHQGDESKDKEKELMLGIKLETHKEVVEVLEDIKELLVYLVYLIDIKNK
jgi:hypothetical protein|tara:strand:+ start:4181 stop:4390 length:210 start_codon:yes stop_codon:yes gene_type:complete